MACAGAAATIASRSRTTNPESKKTWESHTRSQSPEAAAAAKRSPKLGQGSSEISLSSSHPVSASRRAWRRKLWNSCALASTRTVRDPSRQERSRATNSCVLGAKATWRGSETESRRATWACAAGTTVPKTLPHLRSASAAESSQ